MKKTIDTYLLAAKYWLAGDDWEGALKYAKFIVNGFKK